MSRDKSLLRVAASLQDESHPFLSEVASEARLSRERRLASSNSEHPFSSGGRVLGFVLPPSLSLGQRPPFGSTPRRMGKAFPGTAGIRGRRTWEEQDDEDPPDPLDTLRFGVGIDEDSEPSSGDEQDLPWGPCETDLLSMPGALGDGEPEEERLAMDMMDMDMDMEDGPVSGHPPDPASRLSRSRVRSIPSSEAIWTEFRDHHRRPSGSLSTSLLNGREAHVSASPGTGVSFPHSRRPFGPSSLGTSVQDSTEQPVLAGSPTDPLPFHSPAHAACTAATTRTPSTSGAATPGAMPNPTSHPNAALPGLTQPPTSFPSWRVGIPSGNTTSSLAGPTPANSRTRLGKRKVEDRWEPYATSLHKRRAVSPMHLLTHSSLSAGGRAYSPTSTPTHSHFLSGSLSGGTNGGTPTHAHILSGGLGGTAAQVHQASPGTNAHPPSSSGLFQHTRSSSWAAGRKRNSSRARSSRSTSPNTLGPLGSAGAILGMSLHGRDSGIAGSSSGSAPGSTTGSGYATAPASGIITARPSTPTSSKALASPALATTVASATPVSTPKMVASTPISSGSGPGYGSGALGLSLGVNQVYSPGSAASGWTHRLPQEGQEEEEVEEGMSMIGLSG